SACLMAAWGEVRRVERASRPGGLPAGRCATSGPLRGHFGWGCRCMMEAEPEHGRKWVGKRKKRKNVGQGVRERQQGGTDVSTAQLTGKRPGRRPGLPTRPRCVLDAVWAYQHLGKEAEPPTAGARVWADLARDNPGQFLVSFTALVGPGMQAARKPAPPGPS